MNMPQQEVSNLRIQSLQGSHDALDIMGADDSALEVGRGIDAVMAVRQARARLQQAVARLDSSSAVFLSAQKE